MSRTEMLLEKRRKSSPPDRGTATPFIGEARVSGSTSIISPDLGFGTPTAHTERAASNNPQKERRPGRRSHRMSEEQETILFSSLSIRPADVLRESGFMDLVKPEDHEYWTNLFRRRETVEDIIVENYQGYIRSIAQRTSVYGLNGEERLEGASEGLVEQLEDLTSKEARDLLIMRGGK